MITVERIRNNVERHLEGTSHFLVDVSVRPGNRAVVELDDDQAITLEELARLNKALREDLGGAADDWEFQFSSPGIGRPFKVERQYRKHLGRTVEVDLLDGRTLHGQLAEYDGTNLGIRIEHPVKVKGRPPKLDEEVTTIPLAGTKATKATIKTNRYVP